MAKRDARILRLVTESGRIEVARLAELLGVSQVTARKDLDALSEKGLIRREHGFAILASPDDINHRLAFFYDSKKRIAQRAAETVGDNETVMIESGSCCALLAEELSASKAHVTVITNSAFIAGFIRRQSGAHIILLGGSYQNEAQVMVGPLARMGAEQFFVDKLFIGTDGYTEKTGFTGNDYARAETVRDMARQAKSVIVLTESSKFTQQGVVSLLPTERVGMVITDDRIPEEAESHLCRWGVSVIKVK